MRASGAPREGWEGGQKTERKPIVDFHRTVQWRRHISRPMPRASLHWRPSPPTVLVHRRQRHGVGLGLLCVDGVLEPLLKGNDGVAAEVLLVERAAAVLLSHACDVNANVGHG